MSSEAVRGGVAKILLVDDDVMLLKALHQALQNEGYALRAVNRGAQVLEAVAHFRPDLVVLDVMMPGVDGWEVLRRLRENPSTQHVPVIMLTAKDTEDAVVRGFTLGADDYVTKPFSLHELRCRVAAVLRRAAGDSDDVEAQMIPVVVGASGLELVRSTDIYYIEGIRNYTYVHTFDSRFLSRLSLGAIDSRAMEGFLRVHRSYVVNMAHVKGRTWVSKSSYHLRLADCVGTEVPVSRTLIPEVRRRLGLDC